MVNDYMTGTISNCTATTEASNGVITGVYDYTSQFKDDFQKDPLVALQKRDAQEYSIPVQGELKQNKSQKMEVELCLCSKTLWS